MIAGINLFHGHTTITEQLLRSPVSVLWDMMLLESNQINKIINITQALVEF